MFLEKIISKHLGHHSYMIGSQGEAAVIDPRRDCEIYFKIAEEKDVTLKYIFETHRNEDYVIGSKEITSIIDIPILHGKALPFAYGTSVKQNDRFTIGSLELMVLETPGHTDESISIVVKDLSNSPLDLLVFTGDALFAGDTGRIDLYGEDEKERLAENLYHSIHEKLLALGDNVIVCPAHGKGSVCGGNIGDLEYTTIGYEKKTNHLFSKNKNEFIKAKKDEIHSQPPYFTTMENHNKNGPPINHHPPYPSSLQLNEFKRIKKQSGQFIDVRDPISFSAAHIPGSINIWKEGIPQFAGWFLDYEKPIVLIDHDQSYIESISRYLFRLGFDNITGYLQKGFSTWYLHNQEVSTIILWSVSLLKEKLDEESVFILDVREKKTHQQTGHIKGSTHVFVGELEKNLSEIPKEKTIVVYCNAGNMTSIACSILKKHQYPNVVNLLGGMTNWTHAEYPLE